MPEGTKVNSMFGRIASKYDLANRIISFGIDQNWRHRLVDEVDARNPRSIVDLATGSGDVAFALEEHFQEAVKITGMDFCQPMLDEAEKKRAERDSQINFSRGDALKLPIATASVDAVTISFGYRNFEDRRQSLKEIYRSLDPERGHVFILEFSQPHPWYRPFYYFYLKTFLPTLAAIFTGDREAYKYLSDSIEAFPDRDGITKELESAGFSNVKAIPLALGSVALHIGKA